MTEEQPEFPKWQQWLVKISLYLPHQLIGAIAYQASQWRWAPWKNLLIRWFARHYQVDTSEALASVPHEFDSFADFFTRELVPGLRPMPEQATALTSPADGRVSQCGAIYDGLLLQAKGISYSLEALLGGDAALADQFSGGNFLTVYLAPRDYHRVHMPLSGRLRGMTYVPGRMFSVNDVSSALIPDLFTRNERVVAWFDTLVGPVALVLVGAMCVSAIETSWFGRVTVDRRSGLCRWDYPGTGEGVIALARGEEVGRFSMGSTVILVTPPGGFQPRADLAAGLPLRVGESLGSLKLAGNL